jgi:hypothetical protein
VYSQLLGPRLLSLVREELQLGSVYNLVQSARGWQADRGACSDLGLFMWKWRFGEGRYHFASGNNLQKLIQYTTLKPWRNSFSMATEEHEFLVRHTSILRHFWIRFLHVNHFKCYEVEDISSVLCTVHITVFLLSRVPRLSVWSQIMMPCSLVALCYLILPKIQTEAKHLQDITVPTFFKSIHLWHITIKTWAPL